MIWGTARPGTRRKGRTGGQDIKVSAGVVLGSQHFDRLGIHWQGLKQITLGVGGKMVTYGLKVN